MIFLKGLKGCWLSAIMSVFWDYETRIVTHWSSNVTHLHNNLHIPHTKIAIFRGLWLSLDLPISTMSCTCWYSFFYTGFKNRQNATHKRLSRHACSLINPSFISVSVSKLGAWALVLWKCLVYTLHWSTSVHYHVEEWITSVLSVAIYL